MLIIENLFLAIAGLKTNKMRSLLTMLGIIIGISSVIAIVSVGDSISASIEKDMKEMGMENISVDIRRKTDDTQVYYDDDEKPQAEDLLSLNDLKNFQDKFKDKIKTLSFTQDGGSGEVRVGKKQENVYIQGTNYGYSVQKKVKVINGRYLEDKDVERARKVAVIPRELADNIEKQGDEPVGSEIKVFVQDKLITFLVIGIYDNGSKNKGIMAGGFEEVATIYVPATTAGELKNETNFRGFEVSPAYGVSGENLLKDINSYFGDIYSKNKKWECVGYNMQQDMNSYTDMLNKVKMSIAVIAGISLLVGGIGVMNIMLVSVTERTREIGIRKALGAKGKFIRLQFIVEAIIICGIGGMIGVALGLGISAIVVSVMGNALQISLPVIFISVAFSMSIGVFFGYYPANKAAKLDPIEALRYE
nr:ABC transporter permease [uncultured Aminipila sp.]